VEEALYVPFCVSLLCSPSTPSAHAQQQQERNVLLATQLEKILLPSFDLEQLILVPGKHCWALSVDVLGLGADGNLVDAAVLACRAALQDTQLPGVSIEASAEGNEISLSNDPKAAQRLRCDALPIAVTLGFVHDRTASMGPAAYFVDPTAAEEECAQAALTVAFNPQNLGCCCFVEKSGAVVIDPSVLQDMMQVAQSTAQALAAQLSQ
jgi:exosome complex RNA-binding protein Rrp42 (RNase PH superfamily)